MKVNNQNIATQILGFDFSILEVRYDFGLKVGKDLVSESLVGYELSHYEASGD